MSIKSVMRSNHLILCHPLLLLPSIFPSIRVFSNEPTLHIRWPKYWSFSFSISPSNEYSGLISFRIDGFDLLAVQETFKSLLQHHSSKTSILWCSAFTMIQLSHPYMTTGRTIALTRHTFVCKVLSLLFNCWLGLSSEKAMAPHSSTLAWKILRTEEPGRLRSMGSRMTERLPFHFLLSCTGEGNGNLLQRSCLESPGDGGAWWAAVYGVVQSWTRLERFSSSSSNSMLAQMIFNPRDKEYKISIDPSVWQYT